MLDRVCELGQPLLRGGQEHLADLERAEIGTLAAPLAPSLPEIHAVARHTRPDRPERDPGVARKPAPSVRGDGLGGAAEPVTHRFRRPLVYPVQCPLRLTVARDRHANVVRHYGTWSWSSA